MSKFLGAGLLAVDHIYLANGKEKKSQNYTYLGSSGGGTVSNILCMLSILDNENYIFGITGNFIGEKIIKDDLKLFNINYDAVIKRGNKNDIRTTRQFSHRILPNGKHYFDNCCLNCNAKFTRDYQMSINDLNKKVKNIANNKNVIFDRANKVTLSLADDAKKKNKKVIFNYDFNIYGKYKQNAEIMFKYCDIIKTKQKVVENYVGNINERLIDHWSKKYPQTEYLFITKEENGVFGFATIGNEKKYFDFPSFKVDRIKDTSGAGDIFLGVITSNLCNNIFTNMDDFKYMVNLAQSLAALNCTLYGARSLQRFLLKQKMSKNDIIKMAEEIISKGKIDNSFSPTIGLPNFIEKPYRLTKLTGCDVCGNLSVEKKNKIIKKNKKIKNLSMHRSLIQAPWTMLSSYRIGKANREKLIKYKDKNSYLIGSGGSYSAAIFAETLFMQSLMKISKAINPYEIEGFNQINENTPLWYISHGGNNTDILGSAAWAGEKLQHKNGVVLTGNKNSKLAELATYYNWESVFIPSIERNFVSVVGYLSQISALCGILAPDDDIRKLDIFFTENNMRVLFNYYSRKMERLAFEISQNKQIIQDIHIVCLARGWGWPALIDLESKIVEGGICTIEISELKNYTHGRYLNTFGTYDRKNRRVIMFSTPKEEEIIKFLSKKFSRYINYNIIRTDSEGIIGALELIIQSLFLSWYLGRIANKDILKPKFPREARGLYSWEPNWRENKWK